jgi:hypothetical protein
MKNALYIFLPILFTGLILLSGWMCTEFRDYRHIIFYAVSIPCFVGLFITAMILAIMTIGKNE